MTKFGGIVNSMVESNLITLKDTMCHTGKSKGFKINQPWICYLLDVIIEKIIYIYLIIFSCFPRGEKKYTSTYFAGIFLRTIQN